MLDKLKQLKQLRDQANDLKTILAAESITVERDGITLVLNGNQEVVSLTVPETITKAALEKTLPSLFNDGLKQIHRIIAQKVQASGLNFGL